MSLQGLACSPFRRAVVGKFRKALCSDAHLVELRAPRLVRGPGSSSHLALVFLVRLVTLWRVALEVVRVVQVAAPHLVRQVFLLVGGSCVCNKLQLEDRTTLGHNGVAPDRSWDTRPSYA